MTSECFYCGGLFCHTAKKHGDHFPTPARHGGNEMVPCCQACHDMKDRIPMHELHGAFWKDVEKDWHLFSRYSKIYIAKILYIMCDINERERGKA